MLFFAHRSFQEFLVAERLRVVKPTPAAHSEISKFLTPDVIGFLRQAPDQSYLLDWYETLRAANGPVGIPYLQFFASAAELLEHIARTTLALDPHEVDVWTMAILHDAWDRGIQARTDITKKPLDHMLGMSRVARRGNSAAAAVAVLSLLSAYKKDPSQVTLARLVAAVMERCLRGARSEAARTSLTISKDSADFAAEWIGTIRKRHPAHGEAKALQLLVDLDALAGDNYPDRPYCLTKKCYHREVVVQVRLTLYVEGCGDVGEGGGGGQRIALSTGAPGAPQAHRPHVHSPAGAATVAAPSCTWRLVIGGCRLARRRSDSAKNQVLRLLRAPVFDASLQGAKLCRSGVCVRNHLGQPCHEFLGRDGRLLFEPALDYRPRMLERVRAGAPLTVGCRFLAMCRANFARFPRRRQAREKSSQVAGSILRGLVLRATR